MAGDDLSLSQHAVPPDVAQVRDSAKRMRAALMKKSEEGFALPTVGRRRLLQSPIWFDARIARQRSQSTYAWMQESDGQRTLQAIATTNVQPQRDVERGEDRSFNPGGLLTWMDLDLMMFLSAVYAARNVPYIDTDQRAVFSAIGYAALDDPPYHELRSAIKRLLGTQVWLFWENPADGAVEYRALPPLLVQQDQHTTPWQREGKHSKLVVAIGGGWISDVVSENQVIDLNPYLYLVRQIRSADATHRRLAHGRRTGKADASAGSTQDGIIRPPDIARSIYLFCDSLRRLEGDGHKTVLKTSWLLERFGDRHTPIPDAFANLDLKARADRQRQKRGEPRLDEAREAERIFGELPRPDYKYANVMHPNGRIARSLDALQRLGIFSGIEVQGDRMEVRWADPASLPRLSISGGAIAWTDRPAQVGWRPAEQQRLLAVDRATGAIHGVGIQVRAEQPVAPTSSPPANEGTAAKRKADVAFLLRLVPVGRSRLAQARAAGWNDLHLKHLLVIALWRRHGGTVRDAAAFAAHELAEKDPSAYEPAAIESSLDYQAVQRWWLGPESPLATRAQLRERPAAKPSAGASDELVDQVAAELAAHQAAATTLGYAIASLRQRVRSAEIIATDPAKLTAWRAAMAY
jgi:hypothetical protein